MEFARWEVWMDDDPECGDLIEAVNVSHAAEKFAELAGMGDGEQVTLKVSNGKREWKLLVTCTERTDYYYTSELIGVSDSDG